MTKPTVKDSLTPQNTMKKPNDTTKTAQSLRPVAGSTSDTRRIDELLSLGDIYTAAGFPLSSREEIDLHLAYRLTPQTAKDPDEEYSCW